ncbi:MAG: hypothetical protein MUP16_04405 [Sedimentisphaerales bacterium]|nr:hypothetical protein [Sedimentisphaerales bacterium]
MRRKSFWRFLRYFFAKQAIVVAAGRQFPRQVFGYGTVVERPTILAGGDQIGRC